LVYTVIAGRRFRSTLKDTSAEFKKFFLTKYEKIDDKLNQWVFNSVKTVYLSVINFEDIKLDISESGAFFNNTESDLKDRLVKLEIRLNGFIDHLINNTNEQKLGELKEFFQMISTNGNAIPKAFFSNFEYHRLELDEKGRITNITEGQTKMVFSIYIICKILVHNILLLNKASSNIISNNGKRNCKIVSSILYRAVIDYFSAEVSIESKDENEGQPKLLEINENVKNDQFHLAYNEFIGKKIEQFKEEEEKINKIINKKQHREGDDTFVNDIAYINKHLYGEGELQTYYKMAQKSNEELVTKIKVWADKIYNVIKE